MNFRAFIRGFKAAGGFAALVAAAILSSSGQDTGLSSIAPSAQNDNALIEIQRQGGNPTQPGDVRVEFYGHDAFKITSPEGVTVLVDPWRNDPTGHFPKWFGHEFPALRSDIVLSTHAHFDHDAVDVPEALMVLNRLVGQFKLGDVEITGLADKHQCAGTSDPNSPCPAVGTIGFENAIEIIATGGLRFAVWGDNRAVPDPSIDRYLKNVDVLILPVDNVLTRSEAEAILRKYGPKAVIPSHYFVAGMTTKASGLVSAEGWVNDQERMQHAEVRRLDHAELTLNPADLKESHRRIYYFGDHVQKK